MKLTRKDREFLRKAKISESADLLPPLQMQSSPEIQAKMDAVTAEHQDAKRRKITRGKYEFPPVRITHPRTLPSHEERLMAAEEVAKANQELAESSLENGQLWRAAALVAGGAFILSKC